MNRSEHLQWCKDRAMEYVNTNDPVQAVASFMSDMSKHTETADHPALELMSMLLFSNKLNTCKEVEDFVLGFN
jgi:hypothetical protein